MSPGIVALALVAQMDFGKFYMEMSSSIPPMNKNVLLVLVVILTPIVILGVLALSGAENFEKQKEAAEHEEEGTTEAATVLEPIEAVEQLSLPFSLSSPAGLCLAA
jgi:heme/copper-type cytochrome/quinol oxidase subunit 2